MKIGSGGSKHYSDLLNYNAARSPRSSIKNGYFGGLKSTAMASRSPISNIVNGSDKDSVSGRSRKSKTRQGNLFILFFLFLRFSEIISHYFYY